MSSITNMGFTGDDARVTLPTEASVRRRLD
jgi:hypothetical protein